MTPTPQFLVDADIVAFKAASAVETATDWGDGLWTLHGYEKDAHDYCETYFESIKQTLGSGRLVLYLSDKDNWRKDILPTYKANRTGSRKPMLLPAIRQWMIDKYKAVSKEELIFKNYLVLAAEQDTQELKDLLVSIKSVNSDCIINKLDIQNNYAKLVSTIVKEGLSISASNISDNVDVFLQEANLGKIFENIAKNKEKIRSSRSGEVVDG